MDTRDYFGVPLANVQAAQAHHHYAKHLRLNTRVPTRREVAVLPAHELHPWLLDWMTRSATEIIPSRVQINEVLAVLRARVDQASLQEVVEMCVNYLQQD